MSRKPARRSIVASFGALTAPPSPPPSGADAAPGDGGVTAPGDGGIAAPERKGFADGPAGLVPRHAAPRVGAGVIGAAQRSVADMREERDRLLAQVQSGGVVEVDPALVDPSPFPDRLPDDDPASFEALKRTIAEDGQKVPVELRRHPTALGRYQLVYGHRRWRAVQALGLKLRAFVGELDDRAMAMAQGIENAARQDLSWIEKALFALRMEEAGLRARDIRAALVVDDAELARFRSVCRALGADTVAAIGRAPKAGRPRWLELAQAAGGEGHRLDRVRMAIAPLADRPSDLRFAAALSSLTARAAEREGRSALPLPGRSGRPLGRAVFGEAGMTLKVDKREAEPFLRFLEQELPALVDRYWAERGEGSSDRDSAKAGS